LTTQVPWGICFIHYGDPALTDRAVESALLHDPDVPVLVVDDCSPMAYRRETGVTVLRLERNQGYGNAVNAAFAWARERGLQSIFIANNDVRLLESVAPLHRQAVGAAAVAPVVVDTWSGERRSWTVQNAGSRVDPVSGYSITLGRGTMLGDCQPNEHVDFLCGAAVQYNLAAVEKIGGFRDDYFLFWEDAEWCYRATAAGHELKVEPGVVVAHESTATIAGYVDVNMYYRVRNEAWFGRETRTGAVRRRYLARFALVSGPYRVVAALRRIGPRGAYWTLRGVVDGLRSPGKVKGGPRPR
jgi:N-acetylglucosaminyl-diphospho-decaprenol L-rhamnosyltransferase